MTSLPMPQDPEFNINTATNTFYKALGDRVASGQMTLDQARAAQAEMRALQLNPAAANRQTATDIAQRHLQVGRYSPSQPQGGLTAIAPQPIPMQPPMPDRHSEYGIPLWMQLGAGPERDAAYAQYMKAQRGEMQPKFIGKNFTGDAPPPGKKYIETPEGLVPVPINDVPVRPAMGPGLGRALGMPMQGVGMAPQMPQGLTLSNVPRQLTLSNVPQQGIAPQPMSAPQGMAMGGLMEKYYGGGMC